MIEEQAAVADFAGMLFAMGLVCTLVLIVMVVSLVSGGRRR